MCRIHGNRLLRSVALTAAVAAALLVAWRAWRLPHASDDWIHADTPT